MFPATVPTLLNHHIRPQPVVGGRGSPFTGRAVDTVGYGVVRAVLLDAGPVSGDCRIDWGLYESAGPGGEFARIDDGDVLCVGNADIHGLGLLTMRVGPEAGRKRYLRAQVEVSGPGSLIFAVTMELWPLPETRRFFGYDTAADGQNSPVDRRLS